MVPNSITEPSGERRLGWAVRWKERSALNTDSVSDNQYSSKKNRRAGQARSDISSAVFPELSEICRLGFPASGNTYLILQMDFPSQNLLAQHTSVKDNKLFGGLSTINLIGI